MSERDKLRADFIGARILAGQTAAVNGETRDIELNGGTLTGLGPVGTNTAWMIVVPQAQTNSATYFFRETFEGSKSKLGLRCN